jgi:hypothetical protein
MSRRALRESERAHAQATLSDTDEVETPKMASDQQIWSPPPASEPLDYTTQVRQPSVQQDQPLRRPRQSGTPRPDAEPTGYRVRDFSPEARGASFSSTQSAPWTPPASGSEDLNYHTSVEIDRPAPTSYSAPVSAPPVVVTPAEVSMTERQAPAAQPGRPEEHTLTRRELRELRNAAMPRPEDAQLPVERRPMQSPELTAAMAQFDAMRETKQEIPPLVEPPAPAASAFVPPVSEPVVSAPPVTEAPVQAPPVAEAPVSAPPVVAQSAPVAPPQETVQPAEPLREVVTAPEVYAAPPGHWSNQTSIDESYAFAGGPHSRDLSSSDAITTSALVLPTFPVSAPMTGPVSGTGEILLTGSIELPRSLGMSGLHPSRYDSPDIDSIIDAGDREDSAPDSAPVRAIRAVSTHTSSQGIINTRRPKGNNLPMILSVTAGIMMVGVVVLVVAGMIFKIF